MCFSHHPSPPPKNPLFQTILVYISFTGKPAITSHTYEDNGCDVSLAYNPNTAGSRTSEAYHIEYIEIGFFDSARQWKALDRKDGFNYTRRCTVTLPPSLEPVKRELQVAVKYKCCSDVIYSDKCPVQQIALCKCTLAITFRFQ